MRGGEDDEEAETVYGFRRLGKLVILSNSARASSRWEPSMPWPTKRTVA